MSVRRSSRIKKLEIDEPTRQKILFQPGHNQNGLNQGRSIHAGKIRDLPYSRVNGVNRLLRGGLDLQKPDKSGDEESSPLRSVLGKLTDRFQEAIKGIFPFKLFSRPEVNTETETDADVKHHEPVRIEPLRNESVRQSMERMTQSRSRSFEQVLETPQSPNVEAEIEARRQAYAELSAFFTAKKGQPVGPSDMGRVSHLFSTNVSPRSLNRVPSSIMSGRSGVLMTPLPRRMAQQQQQETISRMSSVQRIAPPPTTALKFRTRVPVPSFPPVVERTIVDEDVQAELVKSSKTSPVKQSPMKIDSEDHPKMSQEPSPKKEKRDQSTPNRFVGLFYLDPDEEEEELLRQDRAAQEQQKRIESLVAKKEQRERKIAFRVTAEEKKEVKVEEVKTSVSAPLFDFGPSLTCTPRKTNEAEEKPLINLSTPVKPTAAPFDFPSSTTRIGSADEDLDTKRKRPVTSRPAETLFSKPSESSEKPVFSFAAVVEKPAEAKPVSFTFGSKESEKPIEPLKFSFTPASAVAENKEEEKKPVSFSFGPPAPSAEAPKLSFSFAPPSNDKSDFTFPSKSAEPAAAEAKPVFTFGAAPAESNPAVPSFNFPSAPTSSEDSKPKLSFSFAPPATAESKPAFTFGAAPASSDSKPVISFGATEARPAVSFGMPAAEKPVFSFGAAPSAAPQAVSSQAAPLPFTFGQQPKETEQAKPTFGSFSIPVPNPAESKPFTFGSSTTETKPFTFGAPSETKPAFGFGSSSTAPSFNFSQQQPQTNGGMDMQMEDDGMAQPAPTSSAFGSAASSAFGFGQPSGTSAAVKPFSFANGPSPAPSSVTTPTFGFTSPSPSNQFAFGQQNAAPTAPASTTSFTFAQPSAQPFTFGAQPNPTSSGMDTLASAAVSGGGFNVGAGGSTVPGARKTAPMTRARRR